MLKCHAFATQIHLTENSSFHGEKCEQSHFISHFWFGCSDVPRRARFWHIFCRATRPHAACVAAVHFQIKTHSEFFVLNFLTHSRERIALINQIHEFAVAYESRKRRKLIDWKESETCSRATSHMLLHKVNTYDKLRKFAEWLYRHQAISTDDDRHSPAER